MLDNLQEINLDAPKQEVIAALDRLAKDSGYDVAEVNDTKPWGAYLRFDNHDAEKFIKEFFPGLSLDEARLGSNDAPLSPKILYVSPNERLSWQKHFRRAERWRFLTPGAYHKSMTEEEGELNQAGVDEVVQFEKEECHRLVAGDTPVLVAEIWQHTNPDNLSDEDDIVRLQDDYTR